MGIIVKVYIENNDQEVDILTMNSEDERSSSVTITANFIKDYLNKLSKRDEFSSRRGEKISLNGSNHVANKNNEKNSLNEPSSTQPPANPNNHQCNLNAIHSVCTPNNVIRSAEQNMDDISINESEATTSSSSSNIPSNETHSNQIGNGVHNFVQVINEDAAKNVLSKVASTVALTKDVDTSITSVDEQACFSIVEASNLLRNSCEQPSSPSIVHTDDVDPFTSNCAATASCNQSVVTESSILRSPIIVRENCDINSFGEDGEKYVEKSLNEIEVQSENGIENVIESLKNVSYEVDDFLDLVNNTPHHSISHVPFFFTDFGYSPSICADEKSDGDLELEEFFVIDKIAASRFNEETKIVEFLLKAQRCIPKKYPWSPIVDENASDLSVTNPKCLYIQCPRNFSSSRLKRLNDRLDQHVQFVDMDKGFGLDVFSETTSSCVAINELSSNEFSSLLSTSDDVVVNPQKSLMDACLTEPCVDDSKNTTPSKVLKSGENVDNISDIGLPSAHFFITDIVPGLGDHVIEFLETKDASTTSVGDRNTQRKSTTVMAMATSSSPDRIRKKRRAETKRAQCPNCDYKTTSAVALENHLRRHTQEKLKCGWCEKHFSSSAGRKNHERTHRNGNEPVPPTATLVASALASAIPLNDHCSAVDVAGSNTSEASKQRPTENKDLGEYRLANESSAALQKRVQPSDQPTGAFTSGSRAADDAAAAESLAAVCNSERVMVAAGVPLKRKRGRPKHSKTEGTNEIARMPSRRKKSRASDGGCDELQKCLADTIDIIDLREDSQSETEVSQLSSGLQAVAVAPKKLDETNCDLCQLSFQTEFELLCHKESVHKFPIVLIQRLPD